MLHTTSGNEQYIDVQGCALTHLFRRALHVLQRKPVVPCRKHVHVGRKHVDRQKSQNLVVGEAKGSVYGFFFMS